MPVCPYVHPSLDLITYLTNEPIEHVFGSLGWSWSGHACNGEHTNSHITHTNQLSKEASEMPDLRHSQVRKIQIIFKIWFQNCSLLHSEWIVSFWLDYISGREQDLKQLLLAWMLKAVMLWQQMKAWRVKLDHFLNLKGSKYCWVHVLLIHKDF